MAFPLPLFLPANYTKPTVTMNCDENLGFGCLLTCASHGGYPGTKMMWNVPVSRNSSSQMWKVVNSSEVPNPSTMLFNSSSTAYFNCSNEELKYLSCSVGDVTSDMFSVCEYQQDKSWWFLYQNLFYAFYHWASFEKFERQRRPLGIDPLWRLLFKECEREILHPCTTCQCLTVWVSHQSLFFSISVKRF